MARTPKDTGEDLDMIQGILDDYFERSGVAPVMQDLLWEIIDDVRSSYMLAMGHSNNAVVQVEAEVDDYLSRTWGDR